jgi:hypothetical protein
MIFLSYKEKLNQKKYGAVYFILKLPYFFYWQNCINVFVKLCSKINF